MDNDQDGVPFHQEFVLLKDEQEKMLKAAQASAKFWADFLPKVRNPYSKSVDDDLDIACKSAEKNISLMFSCAALSINFDDFFPSITQEQYNIFIENLTQKITQKILTELKYQEYVYIASYCCGNCGIAIYNDLITHSSHAHAPTEVLEAMRVANIEERYDFDFSFPEACVKTYKSSHVVVHSLLQDRVIYNDDTITHYHSIYDFDFSNSARVKIRNHPFLKDRDIEDPTYDFIGKMITESLGNNYYQYSTAPVMIIKAPDICKEHLCTAMVNANIYTIQPGDLIFKLDGIRNNESEENDGLDLKAFSRNWGINPPHIFPASMHKDFAVYACEDIECSILSNQPINLATLGENITLTMENFSHS